MMKLLPPDIKTYMEEYAFISSIEKEENGFRNPGYCESIDEYKDIIIPRLTAVSNGELPNADGVSESVYYLWDEGGVIGVYRLRHYLNEKLFFGSGHIGYSIHPDFRGKGYAVYGLKLLIELAKDIVSEDELFFSVRKTNPASLKVQMKCGAYIHHEDESRYYTRIKLR